jgi:hypothetical protein
MAHYRDSLLLLPVGGEGEEGSCEVRACLEFRVRGHLQKSESNLRLAYSDSRRRS